MILKNYILSQRLTYLGLGSAVGFLLARNNPPLDIYMIIIFIAATIILGYYFKRKKSDQSDNLMDDKGI